MCWRDKEPPRSRLWLLSRWRVWCDGAKRVEASLPLRERPCVWPLTECIVDWLSHGVGVGALLLWLPFCCGDASGCTERTIFSTSYGQHSSAGWRRSASALTEIDVASSTGVQPKR